MAAHDATGFVLAGGMGTRLGRDKVLAAWNGSSLLENALAKLRSVCGDVNICTNRDELNLYAPVIPDAMDQNGESIGPLGGIVAALESTKTDWNIFLPVDVPLFPAELLAQMFSRVNGTSSVCLGCVPLFEGRAEPLCAVYHRDLLAGLQQAITNRIYKVSDAMLMADPQQSIIRFDLLAAAADWFLNVNTPEELTRARFLASQSSNSAGRPVS